MDMTVTIHRGARQIGGCVTEIRAGDAKVFIDFGTDLPGEGETPPPARIEGLTVPDGSQSALFLTHYHGDHVGRLGEVLPTTPVYMGDTAKAIHLLYARRVRAENLQAIENIRTFFPLKTIHIGGIAVTPLMIDHSAFDAYMFVIESNGVRVLHTGDFRLHGFRGGKTLTMLKKYAANIDYIICENTTLSRDGEAAVASERDLQGRAREIMAVKKYVFVLCGSTNIDRIAAFYHSNPPGRLFVCDEYQKTLLDAVRESHAERSDLYDFSHVYSYAPNLDALMEERGFCMIIRQNSMFKKIMERYKGKSEIIYSMWTGYLKGPAKNEKLADFLRDYALTFLHASGHANSQDLLQLYEAVKPRIGLIPIHGKEPERFRELLPEGKVILLEDGIEFAINKA